MTSYRPGIPGLQYPRLGEGLGSSGHVLLDLQIPHLALRAWLEEVQSGSLQSKNPANGVLFCLPRLRAVLMIILCFEAY